MSQVIFLPFQNGFYNRTSNKVANCNSVSVLTTFDYLLERASRIVVVCVDDCTNCVLVREPHLVALAIYLQRFVSLYCVCLLGE